MTHIRYCEVCDAPIRPTIPGIPTPVLCDVCVEWVKPRPGETAAPVAWFSKGSWSRATTIGTALYLVGHLFAGCAAAMPRPCTTDADCYAVHGTEY